MAAATATLRVVADRHYFTDVATGAIVGSVFGFAIPWLFHYRTTPQDFAGTSGRENAGIDLQIAPTPNGLTAVGAF
jgi:membrane-associated phospholipid phosphatase